MGTFKCVQRSKCTAAASAGKSICQHTKVVTGKAQSGSTVKVMNGSKTLGTVKADAKIRSL
ncbi:hypothetical protein AAAC51_32710 [Priestia megaterium]